MIFSLLGFNGTPLEILAVLIAVIFAILLALSMHEFAHAFVAFKCGDDTAKMLGRLTLNPIKHLDLVGTVMLLLFGFGYAKPVPINPDRFKHYRRDMALVSLAGVIFNIILAIFSALLYLVVSEYFNNGNFFSIFLNLFFYYFTIFNITLFVFNLIPVYPLDGFNLATTFFNDYQKKARFISFNVKYSMIFILIIFIAGSSVIYYASDYIFYGITWLWKLIFGGQL